LQPPSTEELKRRLEARGTDSADTITLRIENARKEIEEGKNCSFFQKHIINELLEKFLEESLDYLETLYRIGKHKPRATVFFVLG
jgi:guanylate kinase